MAPTQESGLRENCTSRLSERAEAGRKLHLPRLYSDEAGVMPVERRERVIAIDQVNCGRVTGRRKSLMINGRRQSSCDGTSRMNREVHVRFCERLGVQFPGPTRLVSRVAPVHTAVRNCTRDEGWPFGVAL